MKETIKATKFKPHECVIFVQSTKIGTHENKAIHSMWFVTSVVEYTLSGFTIINWKKKNMEV